MQKEVFKQKWFYLRFSIKTVTFVLSVYLPHEGFKLRIFTFLHPCVPCLPLPSITGRLKLCFFDISRCLERAIVMDV